MVVVSTQTLQIQLKYIALLDQIESNQQCGRGARTLDTGQNYSTLGATLHQPVYTSFQDKFPSRYSSVKKSFSMSNSKQMRLLHVLCLITFFTHGISKFKVRKEFLLAQRSRLLTEGGGTIELKRNKQTCENSTQTHDCERCCNVCNLLRKEKVQAFGILGKNQNLKYSQNRSFPPGSTQKLSQRILDSSQLNFHKV